MSFLPYLLMATICLAIQRDGGAQAPPRARSAIVAENANEGARDWQLTRVRVDAGQFRSPWIEGYCSKQSVLAVNRSISWSRPNQQDDFEPRSSEWDTTEVEELA